MMVLRICEDRQAGRQAGRTSPNKLEASPSLVVSLPPMRSEAVHTRVKRQHQHQHQSQPLSNQQANRAMALTQQLYELLRQARGGGGREDTLSGTCLPT